MANSELTVLLDEIRDCTICAAHLPHGPRPIVQAGPKAGVVIIGQAPGRRVHESGIPWHDPSGDTLREWLGITSEQFYDPDVVAIVPMGFCYPGSAKSGDLPPRKECAPAWHEPLLSHLKPDRLEVLIGGYAQARYLPGPKQSVTDAVAAWRDHLPERVLMPHPSPRNRHWLTKNPWFEAEALPALRARVQQVVVG